MNKMGITDRRLETRERELFGLRAELLLSGILKQRVPRGDEARYNTFQAIARLGTGREADRALRQLQDACLDPGGETMFVRHGQIDAWFRFGSLYPEPLAADVRRLLTGGDPYRMEHGTENHKIMNAVAGYLAAQAWPDWELAQTVAARCKQYLERYFARVTRYGQGEFDSTTYSVFYLTTLATLHDFCADAELRAMAGMMLDWYLANTACEWLDGRFTGAHSRDYHPVNSDSGAAGGTTAAWLYFGGSAPDLSQGEPHYSAILALSSYAPPLPILHAAQDRAMPFAHLESHDLAAAEEPGHDGCLSPVLGTPAGAAVPVKGYGYISRGGVRKYTYMTQGYALGSMTDGKRGDVAWSGQLRRWSLDWVAESKQSTLFFTHPFPDFGHVGERYVERWLGSSPYEQVVQHESALIALYHIPEGDTYRYGPRESFPSDRDAYIDGFIPEDILLLEEDADGWLYAHGGSVLIAVRTAGPYEWVDVGEPGRRRLRSHGLRNAVVVQSADPADYRLSGEAHADDRLSAELGRFRQAMRERAKLDASLLHGERPEVVFHTLSGDALGIAYDGERTLNDEPMAYGDWPLIGNRFMRSDVGSGKLDIVSGDKRTTWDFNEWSIEERDSKRGAKER